MHTNLRPGRAKLSDSQHSSAIEHTPAPDSGWTEESNYLSLAPFRTVGTVENGSLYVIGFDVDTTAFIVFGITNFS